MYMICRNVRYLNATECCFQKAMEYYFALIFNGEKYFPREQHSKLKEKGKIQTKKKFWCNSECKRIQYFNTIKNVAKRKMDTDIHKKGLTSNLHFISTKFLLAT